MRKHRFHSPAIASVMIFLCIFRVTVLAQVDCNENGLPDDEDIATARSIDCNGNNTPDECDIDATGKSAGGPYFCTANCLPDCNFNGILDTCEMTDCGTVDVAFLLETSDDGVRRRKKPLTWRPDGPIMWSDSGSWPVSRRSEAV